MKIAILMLNKGRGSGVVAKEHAEYLIDKGHKLYFIQPDNDQELEDATNIDVELGDRLIPVHEYLPSAAGNQKAVSSMDYNEAVSYLPTYEKALESIINKVDLVVAHHANLTAVATHRICNKFTKPYVLFIHGTGIEPRHHGQYDDDVWHLIENALNSADGIIVTTEYVRDELVRNLVNIPLDKFLIQPCGINLKTFVADKRQRTLNKYDIPDEYVICPGALTHAKGPQNVVEATSQYADLAPTIFIGDGELRTDLEEKLSKRGKFLGFVSNQEKADLIYGATLLAAAPEKKEHFGIIYIEAMAGGTPVIAYEGGGVNSIVSTESGVLTNRNAKDLGNAVRSLLLDKSKRKRMSSEGRRIVEEKYSSVYLGQRLESWLTGLIF